MSVSVRQSKQLIRQHLLSSDAIQAAVGDRIYTQHAMFADLESVEYPCIILEALIGRMSYGAGLHTITYDIYVYSHVSQDEAEAVYDLMFNRLHTARLYDSSGTIQSAGGIREIERPDDGWNEQTKAWWIRGKWIATLARGEDATPLNTSTGGFP